MQVRKYPRFLKVELNSIIPPDVLVALNVLQALYKRAPDHPVPLDTLVEELGNRHVDVQFVCLRMSHQGYIDSVRRPWPGYVINDKVLQINVQELMKVFNIHLESPTHYVRASDRADAAVYDALTTKVQEFIE